MAAAIVTICFCPGHTTAEETSKTAAADFDRARKLFESGQLVEASEMLERIVADTQSDSEAELLLISAYRLMGIEYYGQSRYHDAEDMWRRALKYDPQNKEILGFIERSRSEQSALDNITGEGGQLPDSLPFNDEAARPSSDSSSSMPPTGVSETLSPGVPSKSPRLKVKSGISLGKAFGTGDAVGPDHGFTFSGHLLFPLASHRLGIRLQGDYTRFYEETNISGLSRETQLTIFGGSLELQGDLPILSNSSIRGSAGVGLYETFHSTPTLELATDFTERTRAAGLALGIGWRQLLGPISSFVDLHYIHLTDSPAPDMITVSAGIGTP